LKTGRFLGQHFKKLTTGNNVFIVSTGVATMVQVLPPDRQG